MKNNYVNVHLFVRDEDFEIATALIADSPILGIEERYDELVVCYYQEDWTDELQNEIVDTLKTYKDYIEIKEIEIPENKNWNEEIEKQTPPIIVSDRIAITPEWHRDKVNQELTVIINPKMSFGTGQHATTKLVSRLMENLVKPNDYWIDAGTGTGVLAILAAKLGASAVYAFDNDEWSVENANENAEINNVIDLLTIEMQDIDNLSLPEANGIAANLFLHLVERALPRFFESLKNTKGDLLISGILIYDKDVVIQKALSCGFELVNTITEDEWIAFHFKG